MFLAVSPEEKESWVNALNVAIVKAKNRILDEVRITFICLMKLINLFGLNTSLKGKVTVYKRYTGFTLR